MGFLAFDALRDLHREHEVYVSSSTSDSTSQSLLEAMAAGLVPIVTSIEGNRGWVVHRGSGLLVPPGDPLALASAITEVARAGEVVREGGRCADTVARTEQRLEAIAHEIRSRARDGVRTA